MRKLPPQDYACKLLVACGAAHLRRVAVAASDNAHMGGCGVRAAFCAATTDYRSAAPAPATPQGDALGIRAAPPSLRRPSSLIINKMSLRAISYELGRGRDMAGAQWADRRRWEAGGLDA
jgi:hypothetical protein